MALVFDRDTDAFSEVKARSTAAPLASSKGKGRANGSSPEIIIRGLQGEHTLCQGFESVLTLCSKSDTGRVQRVSSEKNRGLGSEVVPRSQ